MRAAAGERERFAYSNPEHEAALRGATTPEALAEALVRLNDLIPSFMHPPIYARRLHSFGLDETVPLIASRLGLKDTPGVKSNDNVCIVVTRLYSTGGHSQVVADIARAMGAENTTLIYSDIFKHFRYPSPLPDLSRFSAPNRALILLQAPTLSERITELYTHLRAIRPTRIFLVSNHMDMVSVAGCWPFRSVVDFIHHADYMPSIGATLPFSAHVDLTYTCHLACREAGLDPIYSAMKAARPAVAPPPTPEKRGLLFATCGHSHKYVKPGRYRWADFALAALRTPESRMLHIGPADDAFRQSITSVLAAEGIDPARYEFRGVAPLQAELISRGVDLYVSSYPEPGGRANLEAMIAGLPCLAPTEIAAGPLIVDRFPLPQFHLLSRPDELSALIGRSAELKDQAAGPEARAALDAEMSRFDSYLAGEALSPTADERLPEA